MGALTNRTVVLFKEEATPGTDPIPTGALNAIRVERGSSFTMNPEVTSRDEFNGSLSASDSSVTLSNVTISISAFLKGSGVRGDVGELSPLLRCCTLKEDVNGGVSVIYTPSSDPADLKTGTFYWYEDGICYRANHCTGSASLAYATRSDPRVNFTFQGILDTQLDENNPTVTYNPTAPVHWRGNNGGAVLIDATPVKASTFNLDMAVTVQGLDDANSPFGISEYDPVSRNVTGDINPAQVSLATRNVFDKILNATKSPIQVVNGDVAGNIITLDVPNAIWTSDGSVDDAGHRRKSHSFQASGANAEFTLTFT